MANGGGVPMLYGNVDPRLARWIVPGEECLPPGEMPIDVALRRWLSRPVMVAPVEGLPTATTPPLTFPPWLFAPFGVRPVDEPQSLVPAAIAPGGSASFAWPVVPPGRIGVVDRIGVSSSDFTALTVFQTRSNAQPIAPWGARTGNPGTLQDPVKLAAPIILSPGQIFDIFVTNNGVGAITVAVRMLGWWYASQ